MSVVWHIAAVADVQLPAGLDERALTDHERTRRDALAWPADRAAFEAAHLLVRACAAELVGDDIDATDIVLHQRCATCGADGHGAPYVDAPDVHVSLAHARGAWVAAVAAHAPCGIDVEPRAASIPPRALTPREDAWVTAQPDPLAAFTQLWVRKEALVKAGAASLAGTATLDALNDAGTQPATTHGLLAITPWHAPDHTAFGAVTTTPPSNTPPSELL